MILFSQNNTYENHITTQLLRITRKFNMTTFADNLTTLIDISQYQKPFEDYPEDFVQFCNEHGIELKNIKSKMGQAYALMSQPEVRGQKHLTRPEAEAFFRQIGYETGDAIQAFNKAVGLRRVKGRGLYCLLFPFETDLTDIEKRKGAKIGGDRDEQINFIKTWWRENLLDVPNHLWQIGHLDPTIPDSSETNLAFQPPIQGKYRDRFKWCPMFQRMWPTAKEWISKMNSSEYHTEEEQREMYEALKTKFEHKA